MENFFDFIEPASTPFIIIAFLTYCVTCVLYIREFLRWHPSANLLKTFIPIILLGGMALFGILYAYMPLILLGNLLIFSIVLIYSYILLKFRNYKQKTLQIFTIILYGLGVLKFLFNCIYVYFQETIQSCITEIIALVLLLVIFAMYKELKNELTRLYDCL